MSERSFRRKAETELSGLCDDEGLGCNPNKHFRKAKMASVLTLALLAVSAFPGKPEKKAGGVFPTLPDFHMAISS